MDALWADSTSDRSTGMACAQICWEVGSSVCSAATDTAVIRVPRTVTLTAIVP